ncbi:hypothetical protein CEP52_008766 [Fusarium oligoseptatum]|uniref:Uncharacterized protein n=1 Tax=Fusarium oligoseptatum TaxID=2604345 RepID=A0A428TGE6_9HYPO|nr:hypothetical protein CEP52_008766 [Fusarium oligoseptatum]
MSGSIVEANLIITHVAPKLIGESRYSSKTGKSGKTGDNSKPPTRALAPTSQSRRDRHQYSQFNAEGQRSEEFVLGPIKGRADPRVTAGNSDDHVGWGDSDSERDMVDGTSKPAIVQARAVAVGCTDGVIQQFADTHPI